VSDPTYEESAAEANLIRDWIDAMADIVGVPASYADGSIQHRVDRVTTDDLDDHRLVTRFVGQTVPNPWVTRTGTPVISEVAGGQLVLDLDDAAGDGIDFGLYQFQRAHLPVIEAQVLLESTSNPALLRIGYESAAGDGWGIKLDGSIDAAWRVYAINGGEADVTTNVVVTINEWYTVRAWVTGTAGAQVVHASVTKAGAIVGTAVISATQPPVDRVSPAVFTGAGGPAGKDAFVKVVRVEADFSQAVG